MNPKDARVSVILMKFLRARYPFASFDILKINEIFVVGISTSEMHTAAHDMLVMTLRWQDEFNVDAAVKEKFPGGVFGSVGHVFGHDKEGRPVVYVSIHRSLT